MSDLVLNIEAVSKGYALGKPGEIRVLDDLSMQIKAGEAVALVAPSGAGKSTLLHLAGLLDGPDTGTVAIAGHHMGAASDTKRTVSRRRDIGFVYQFHHLLPEFSALENVMMPQLADGVGRGAAAARAQDLLGLVGLAARADHRPAELSGGEQQRVAICRALANRPRLLLADEPTGNLDPGTSDLVFGVLRDLVQGEARMGALIATHNLDLAGRMDRVLRLENGKIVEA